MMYVKQIMTIVFGQQMDIENILRYEPKGLLLVFPSKGKMYSNSKSAVVPRFKELGSCTSPVVDNVVVDLRHFLYSSASKPALKNIRDLFNVSNTT